MMKHSHIGPKVDMVKTRQVPALSLGPQRYRGQTCLSQDFAGGASQIVPGFQLKDSWILGAIFR